MLRKIFLSGLLGALAGAIEPVTAAADAPADRAHSSTPAPHPTGADASAARERIAVLRAELARHDRLYFEKASPEISDAAYDALTRELLALEQTLPGATTDTPAATIVDDHTEGFSKAAHRAPMLGLEKACTEAELRAFCARVTATLGKPASLLIEPKIDGVAVSAIYERGVFARAITRGNGIAGDDITANVRLIRNLPHELRRTNTDGSPNPIPEFIELRGEIYVSRADFLKLNREREQDGEPPFAHPRTIAAGTIKSRDSGETAERGLAIVFHGWGACVPPALTPATQAGFHSQAKAWGLPTLERRVLCDGDQKLWGVVQNLGKTQSSLAAPTDGVVIKLDEVASRDRLGSTPLAPRWAVAFKFPAEQATTTLRSITLQVGRTGLLTPVAELAPVPLGGSIVTRATLHNARQIARLDLRVGDTVIVEKAGEIIPAIVGIELGRRPRDAKPYLFPENCPACGVSVEIAAGSTLVQCRNDRCSARLERALAHFVGKTGISINGLGPATLAKLVKHQLIHEPADLYRLHRDDLVGRAGLGEKMTDDLIRQIARSRSAELHLFIQGLGIPRVGPGAAKMLAAHFDSLEELAHATALNYPSSLSPGTRESLATYFSSATNRAGVLALHRAITTPAAP
jgi:DNA ligase (NAD+)